MRQATLVLAAVAALFALPAGAQEYQDNRPMEQRGMDALRNFLGSDSQQRQVSPDDIVRELERRNFHNISDPVQRGHTYLVYAVDPEGQDVELTIDADSGRIVDKRYRG